MKYHDSFIKFWVIQRVKKKIHKIGFKFSQMIIYLLKFMGFWYCADCNKYHSPRVMNFNPDEEFTDGSCDPEYLEKLKDLEAVEADI